MAALNKKITDELNKLAVKLDDSYTPPQTPQTKALETALKKIADSYTPPESA